jgi:hypothetical protein
MVFSRQVSLHSKLSSTLSPRFLSALCVSAFEEPPLFGSGHAGLGSGALVTALIHAVEAPVYRV